MDPIHVTLPDGSVKQFPKGTTPVEVAKSISPRLAEAALVAKVSATDGNGAKSKSGIFSNSIDPAEDGSLLYDLRRPLEQDVKLQLLTEKDPDALYVFRHSAAHLLAAAVMELYPNVKLGIGPPVENGFFYEFLREEPFTPDDLVKIEKKMHELAAQDLPNERKLLPKEEALKRHAIALDTNKVAKFELVRREIEGKKGKGHRQELQFTVWFQDIKGARKLEEYLLTCGKSTLSISYTKQPQQADLPGVEANPNEQGELAVQ
jgi:threonyl-tRNA synthetase